ncbi:MAG: hypothetical protein E7165_04055 [Firmicutes bacterium]|nr:hypothetical protein [Bacillota bacterium]
MKKMMINKRLIALLTAVTTVLTISGCENNYNNDNNLIDVTSDIDNLNDDDIITLFIDTDLSENTAGQGDYTTGLDDITTEYETKIDYDDETTKIDELTTRVEETTGIDYENKIDEITSNFHEEETKKTDVTTKIEEVTTGPEETTTMVEETTTNATTTVVPEVIVPPITSEKLTINNINDASIITQFVISPAKNIYEYNGEALFVSINYKYNGNIYICGDEEFKMFIALLNETHIEVETLKELFRDATQEDIDRYSSIFRILSSACCSSNIKFKYDNFIVDNNVKDFLNQVQNNFLNYKKHGNIDEFNTFVQNYFDGQNEYIRYGENVILDYYFYIWCSQATQLYNNTLLNYIIRANSSASSQYYDYIQNEFSHKTRSNQLTLR